MTRHLFGALTLALASVASTSGAAVAQAPAFSIGTPSAVADSAAKPAAAPAAKPDSEPKPEFKPSWNFSAWLFGTWTYQTDSATKANNNGSAASRFTVDRAYLTFRGQVAPDFGFRVTTDVKTLPVANGIYNGLVIRLKYAYMQWDYMHPNADGMSAWARIGQIHTVVVDYEENFWPRWLQKTALEYWAIQPSSADEGASTQLSLPNKLGQAYLTIGNGGGYETAVDADRFKDIALRFSITPLAKQAGLLKSLTVTPWFQVGRSQASLVLPPLHPGLENNAGGIFVGNNDPRLTFGAEYAERQIETMPTPPAKVVTTARLYDGFVQVRPALFSDPKGTPWGIVLRYDEFKANTANAANRTLLLAGVFLDVSKATSFGLSYQDDVAHSPSNILNTKTLWQLNWQITF
jgi:hypothetical protein